MASRWYRLAFPTRLAPARQAMAEFETTAQGRRISTSVGGVLTGRGADLIVIDDPLKPDDALSEARRQAANEWYDHTLYSRLKRYGTLYFVFLEVFYRGSDLEQRSNLPRCLSRYLLVLRHSLTALFEPSLYYKQDAEVETAPSCRSSTNTSRCRSRCART